MLNAPFFRKYLLPGFVFQSIVIGGGYGTGRELVEFFLKFGPLGGLLGMALSTAIWSAVCLVTFELARRTGSYDYRAFTRQLLHRWWFLYEICYLIMMLLSLAVIAAASGSIVEAVFSLPYHAGVIGIMACVGFLVFKGTAVIEKSFAVWSFVLYAIYLVFLVWSLSQFFGGNPWPSAGDQAGMVPGGRQVCRIQHGGHPGPSVLHPPYPQSRREAVGAGILVGPIGMIPAFFFFLAMVTQYPAVVNQTVSRQFSPGGTGVHHLPGHLSDGPAGHADRVRNRDDSCLQREGGGGSCRTSGPSCPPTFARRWRSCCWRRPPPSPNWD